MGEFAGLTLAQLEAKYHELFQNAGGLCRLLAELLERKRRRALAGRGEKPRAGALRATVTRRLLEILPPTESATGRPTSATSRPSQESTSSGMNQAACQAAPPVRIPVCRLGFSPTEEQQRAITNSQSCERYRIQSFAGAGLSSMLALIADRRRGRGLYVSPSAGHLASTDGRD